MKTNRNSDVGFSGLETVVVLIIGVTGILLVISAFRFISPLDFFGRIVIGGIGVGFCLWHIKNIFKRR